MHYDEPPKRQLDADDKQQESISNNVRTIAAVSILTALVVGLTSVIYLVAKEMPESFSPVIIPIESQPAPPEVPVKEAPQPKH